MRTSERHVHRRERPSASEGAASHGLRGRGTQRQPASPGNAADGHDHASHDGQGVSHRRGPPVNWGNGLADSEPCRAATGSTRSGTSTPSPGAACSPATGAASSTTTARSSATTAAPCGSRCRTEFRGWRHPLAAPRIWTPIFFLDDAVALAAGHRPCALCRRDDYRAYRDAVTGASGRAEPLLAADLNQRLAGERHRRGRGLVRAPDRRTWSGADRGAPTGHGDPRRRAPTTTAPRRPDDGLHVRRLGRSDRPADARRGRGADAADLGGRPRQRVLPAPPPERCQLTALSRTPRR